MMGSIGLTAIEQLRRVVNGMANEDEDAVLAGIARILELEEMLRELVQRFNPVPARPALTIWDRAAEVLNRR